MHAWPCEKDREPCAITHVDTKHAQAHMRILYTIMNIRMYNTYMRGPCEKDREPIMFEHECNVNNKQFIDTCLCVYY
jgi:hypothetical protein